MLHCTSTTVLTTLKLGLKLEHICNEEEGQVVESIFEMNKFLYVSVYQGRYIGLDYYKIQGPQRNKLIHLSLRSTGLVATEDTTQALTTML